MFIGIAGRYINQEKIRFVSFKDFFANKPSSKKGQIKTSLLKQCAELQVHQKT